MKFKHQFFAILLLFVMVLNIGRYQLPYIEYSLFKGYIAENLCVKKDVANNCCQGKCFIEKQIKLTDETENATQNTNNVNNKKTTSLSLMEFVLFDSYVLNLNEITKLQLFRSETILITTFVSDAFVPPKQLF